MCMHGTSAPLVLENMCLQLNASYFGRVFLVSHGLRKPTDQKLTFTDPP